MKIGKKQLVEIFDILFIMILCFITLLTTMLMQGAMIVGGDNGLTIDYSFGLVSLIVTLAAMIIYFMYIIPKSDAELRNMINKIYTEKDKRNESQVKK